MAVNYLLFKRNKSGTVGTGFFTFDGNCPEGIKLVEVTGTMTITDGINTLNINIKNNKISMPTIVYARNLEVDVPVILHGAHVDGLPDNMKLYEIAIGDKFKSRFIVKEYEFIHMAKEIAYDKERNFTTVKADNCNVIHMKIAFKTEGQMSLISKS